MQTIIFQVLSILLLRNTRNLIPTVKHLLPQRMVITTAVYNLLLHTLTIQCCPHNETIDYVARNNPIYTHCVDNTSGTNLF